MFIKLLTKKLESSNIFDVNKIFLKQIDQESTSSSDV